MTYILPGTSWSHVKKDTMAMSESVVVVLVHPRNIHILFQSRGISHQDLLSGHVFQEPAKPEEDDVTGKCRTAMNHKDSTDKTLPVAAPRLFVNSNYRPRKAH